MKERILLTLFIVVFISGLKAQQANPDTYLKQLIFELQQSWPNNRTINLVFHGHSVPSGYSTTPIVNTLSAYPYLTLKILKDKFPTAVVNVITTSIGGEQSEQGEKRMGSDVFPMKPDVLFIDYALNDRNIGLKRTEVAWRKMIVEALKYGCKLILLTPTPDLSEDILNDEAPLAGYSRLIRKLASEYKVGLVDSYLVFKKMKQNGTNLADYMAQNNHPNERGHQVVATEISKWFNSPMEEKK
jgi:lysophospholipase L1-like esterase